MNSEFIEKMYNKFVTSFCILTVFLPRTIFLELYLSKRSLFNTLFANEFFLQSDISQRLGIGSGWDRVEIAAKKQCSI